MTIKINDVELEFNDADTMDLVQSAIENLSLPTQAESDRVSDKIRQPCIMIDNMFDEIFGDGASEAVFEGKMNMKTHMDGFIKIVEAVEKAPEEINAMQDEYLKIVKKKPAVKKSTDHLPKMQPATKKKFTSKK